MLLGDADVVDAVGVLLRRTCAGPTGISIAAVIADDVRPLVADLDHLVGEHVVHEVP